jgi:hypothetical protein
MTYLFTIKAVTTEVPRETNIKCVSHSYRTSATSSSCQQFLNLRDRADKSRLWPFYKTKGLDSSKISVSRKTNTVREMPSIGGGLETTRQAGVARNLGWRLRFTNKLCRTFLGHLGDSAYRLY